VWRWVKRHTTAAITLPALGLVLGLWPALFEEADVRPELLPDSLATPLGWYRLMQTAPALYVPVSLASLVLFAAFGWLVVRVARPPTTARAIGFAAGVAAVAAVCQVLLTAPLLMERGRAAMADADDLRVHPVEDADPNSRWVTDAKRPGTDAHDEAEYLKRFLPPEKQGLDYDGWETDLKRLKRQSASVNRLQAGYRSLGAETLTALVGTVVWAVFSTWVVMYLDRAFGRRWSNLVRYVELTWTTGAAAVGVLLAVAVAAFAEEQTFMWVGGGYLAALAVVAWVGVVRRWRWWVRWGLYALGTGILFAIAVVSAIVQHAG